MVAKTRYLAFDLGASSGRTILGEWDGSHLACEEIYHFPNDAVTVNESIYWDVLRLFHEIKQGLMAYSARFGGRVDGVGIDTWGVDFAFLGRDGRLLGNPHHHRDSRFASVAEELKLAVGGYEVYADTGVMIEQVSTLTQLYALARNGSPVMETADKFLMIPSLLNYFLSGIPCDEHSNISNTGLVGYRDGKVMVDLLARMGIRADIFPKFVQPGSVLGELQASTKRETGIASAPVVACATHDTASAVISIPASPGASWAFLSCGTWSVLGIETSRPVATRESYERGLTTAATADGKFMTRKNLTGLWIIQELRRIWSQAGETLDYVQTVMMAESASPFRAFIDVDDPAFVHPADMSQAIVDHLRETGQEVPSNRDGVLRCVHESMALKYRSVLESIRTATGASVDVLHVVGGGVRNRLLCQFTANALQIPVIAGPIEATSVGNLLMQLIAVAEVSTVEDGRGLLRSSVETIEYAPRDADAWNEAYIKYLSITRRERPPASTGR